MTTTPIATRLNRLAWRALLPALALALGACAATTDEEIETHDTVNVTVETVQPGSIRAGVQATGAVKPAPGAELMVVAPQTARILEMPKAEGDTVRAGDLLVRFEIPSLEADLASKKSDRDRAKARLETARSAASRLEGLLERGIAARREVEDAHRELAEAEAASSEAASAVAAAEQLQRRGTVKAPFAGLVAGRWHNPGDLVDASSSDPILRLIDPAKLQVEVFVPVSDLPRLAVGGAAEVTAPGGGPPERATVRTGASAVDPATGSAAIRLAFDGPNRLPAGTPVQVLLLGEERRGALTVPEGCLVREGSDSFLYIVDAGSRARRRKVEVGLTAGGRAEIISGLSAGDRVIVRGQEALPDGAAVTVSQP